MTTTETHLLDELAQRGLVATCTDLSGLRERIDEGTPLSPYVGFDPTAASLHIGSLQGLQALRLMARHGHAPIALVGGFTGMVGDPSGKSAERNLLDTAELDHNRECLTRQISELLGHEGDAPTIVDNRTWFESMTALELLRDIGKLVSLSDMLERASVKQRLSREGGLSYTEFSYQLLQAHDFVHLRREHGCDLQLGGTDQYGNITAGIDMIRRHGLGRAYGLVWPLVVKQDGSKFGKTEQGNVWLDGALTSPYAFHQFWFNTPDADVGGLLARFTLIPRAEIAELMDRHRAAPGERIAQRRLAEEVTSWVHGAAVCAAVQRAAAALFGGRIDRESLPVLEQELGTLRITRDELRRVALDELVVRAGLCASTSAARRTIKDGGVYVDGKRSTGLDLREAQADWIVLARGRRHHAIVRVVG